MGAETLVHACLLLWSGIAKRLPALANARFGIEPVATDGMNSLWASDFNNFSSDNCTPTSQLKFSFSSDVNDNFRTYNCDSLGKRTVELWVTDLAGNQSRAKTYVIVQDNSIYVTQRVPKYPFQAIYLQKIRR